MTTALQQFLKEHRAYPEFTYRGSFGLTNGEIQLLTEKSENLEKHPLIQWAKLKGLNIFTFEFFKPETRKEIGRLINKTIIK